MELALLHVLKEDLDYIRTLEENPNNNCENILGLSDEDLVRVCRVATIIFELSIDTEEVIKAIGSLLRKGYDPYICLLMAFHAGVTAASKIQTSPMKDDRNHK